MGCIHVRDFSRNQLYIWAYQNHRENQRNQNNHRGPGKHYQQSWRKPNIQNTTKLSDACRREWTWVWEFCRVWHLWCFFWILVDSCCLDLFGRVGLFGFPGGLWYFQTFALYVYACAWQQLPNMFIIQGVYLDTGSPLKRDFQLSGGIPFYGIPLYNGFHTQKVEQNLVQARTSCWKQCSMSNMQVVLSKRVEQQRQSIRAVIPSCCCWYHGL